ncbi:phosphoesterase, MJ0936 family [Gottschalkia purinilytica]|uniref:Phosphoesterase n=1 Tax=Gottschalkia purinilytica TaxID=1503 RepID=A0A0L0W7E8_GOTPU|nr:metallophosphoesterase [Gottschalkia purinilytica]KNF07225.1 phosphoesterase, MJ0936 family [Gottschalkia purinilytica]
MRIVVLSDTHGSIDNSILKISQLKDVDIIIHLGDNVKDAINLKEKLGIEVIYVKGNCDFLGEKSDEEKIISLNNKKFFITHGHLYDVKKDMNKIFYRGKELGANVILFGHSHVPTVVKYEDILLLNPGSPTKPRIGSNKSIGLIEIKNDHIEGEILALE